MTTLNYAVLGMNHKTAPVALREKFSLSAQAIPDFLRRLMSHNGLAESVVLSTCNRFELYTALKPGASFDGVLEGTLGSENLPEEHFYRCQDREAVSHLFRVTASLDSLVLGENQIAGQVKQAYQLAQEQKTIGPYLNRLFPRALHVAKRIKTETEVGKRQVSVGSVAVQLAKKIFGDLSKKSVVLLGAGKVGELVWQHLAPHCDANRVTVINRSRDRAARMVADQAVRIADFKDLDEILLTTDILMTSLSTTLTDHDAAWFAKLMQKRGNEPLLLIDLGMPRNLLPGVGKLPDVYLYNVDDLQTVAAQNQNLRQSEIQRAQGIISEETELFFTRREQAIVLPTIAGLNRKFEEIRCRELKKSLAKLGHLSASDCDAIDRLTQSIVNKALHDPILMLRTDKESREGQFLSSFKRMFRLGEDEDEYQ